MALRCDKRPCPSPVQEDDFDAELRDYGRAHDLSKCKSIKRMSEADNEVGFETRDKALIVNKRPCPSPIKEDDFDADLRDYERARRKTKQMSEADNEVGVGARDKPMVVNNVDMVSWDMFMRNARGQPIVRPKNFGGIQEELYSTLANLQKQTITSGILKNKPLMAISQLSGSQKVGLSALVVFFDVWDSMTDATDDEGENKVRNIFVNIDINPKGLASIKYEQVHSTDLDSSVIVDYLRRFRPKENKAKMLRP